MHVSYMHEYMCIGGSEVKASACNVGDLGLIPGLGRSPGEGNGNPLQYSCLENPIDRGAWWATVHGVVKSRTQLSDFTLLHMHMYVCVLSNSVMCDSCDPMDCSLPSSSVYGILQARVLECVAISSSRGSSQTRDQTHVSCISRWVLYL